MIELSIAQVLILCLANCLYSTSSKSSEKSMCSSSNNVWSLPLLERFCCCCCYWCWLLMSSAPNIELNLRSKSRNHIIFHTEKHTHTHNNLKGGIVGFEEYLLYSGRQLILEISQRQFIPFSHLIYKISSRSYLNQ